MFLKYVLTRLNFCLCKKSALTESDLLCISYYSWLLRLIPVHKFLNFELKDLHALYGTPALVCERLRNHAQKPALVRAPVLQSTSHTIQRYTARARKYPKYVPMCELPNMSSWLVFCTETVSVASVLPNGAKLHQGFRALTLTQHH